MEKKERTKKVSKNKKTTTPKKNNEVSIFTILFIMIILSVLAGIYLGVKSLVITFKYKEYTDKMVSYGYNELYENKKATSVQKVTNSELLKVVIGSIKNDKNISNLYYLSNKELSESQNWYEYSEYIGVNSIISKNELDKKATLIDAVMFTVNCIETFIDVNIEATELKMSEKTLNKYTAKEKELIAKAVTLGLIKNKTSELSKATLIKGELNKLVVSAVEEYATMHYKNTIVNENGETVRQNVNLVTDKEKMPENYKDYPYIIDSIDKDIYEYKDVMVCIVEKDNLYIKKGS